MVALTWDVIGERRYETGLDRGVLYLSDRSGIAWNGLTSIEENATDHVSFPVYIDGLKVAEINSAPEFKATLKAFTYPDEFLEFEGSEQVGHGLYASEQPHKPFHLSFRTGVGTDLDPDQGYQIHILYNLIALPNDTSNETISDQLIPVEFGWKLSAVPEQIPWFRPTAHVILDTTLLGSYLTAHLENLLYGTETTAAYLPSLVELAENVLEWALWTIVDNGDGTWTASGPDELLTMISDTEFQLEQVVATYSTLDTYTISSG